MSLHDALAAFAVKYRDNLYIGRSDIGLLVLTEDLLDAIQFRRCPTRESVESLAKKLGLSSSDLSIVRCVIFEISESQEEKRENEREVQKHIDAGHNLTNITTLDSSLRFLCSCGVKL